MSSVGSKESTLDSLRARLEQAEQILEAFRNGEIDAVVVTGRNDPRVYTLEGPDRPFRVFVEQMQKGALTIDEDETILYANGFLADLLKVPLERVMGARLSSFISPHSTPGYQTILREPASEHGGEVLHLVASDGEEILAHLSITRIRGSVLPLFGIVVSDLREQERAHQTEVAREAAEAANLAKDDFLAVLSHELRTPLNAVLGWTQILAQTEVSAEELRRGLAVIERNARAQAQLISDLLDMSRITSGKLRLELENVDLGSVLEAAVVSVAPMANAKDIQIETRIDHRIGPMVGDSARLQQVVWNLLTNAIKFTGRGGRIRIVARRTNAHAEIEVTDNGQGVPPELLPKLFDSFQQAEAASTRRAAGLGLGLAIVKRLVEAQGGSVSAFSAGEGRGSTFAVRFPSSPRRELPPTERSDPESAKTPPLLNGARVLLVEHELDARELLERLLTRRGAEVVTATSVEEALVALEETRPEVLVSDIAMPVRDGYELIRAIRARGFPPERLPAIAVSALARPEDRRRALVAGYQVHVAKPLEEEEIIGAIAGLIGGRANPT